MLLVANERKIGLLVRITYLNIQGVECMIYIICIYRRSLRISRYLARKLKAKSKMFVTVFALETLLKRGRESVPE